VGVADNRGERFHKEPGSGVWGGGKVTMASRTGKGKDNSVRVTSCKAHKKYGKKRRSNIIVGRCRGGYEKNAREYAFNQTVLPEMNLEKGREGKFRNCCRTHQHKTRHESKKGGCQKRKNRMSRWAKYAFDKEGNEEEGGGCETVLADTKTPGRPETHAQNTR